MLATPAASESARTMTIDSRLRYSADPICRATSAKRPPCGCGASSTSSQSPKSSIVSEACGARDMGSLPFKSEAREEGEERDRLQQIVIKAKGVGIADDHDVVAKDGGVALLAAANLGQVERGRQTLAILVADDHHLT